MKYIINNLVLFLVIQLQYANAQNTLQGKGVLRINLLKFTHADKLNIYDAKGQVFAAVYKDPKDDEYKISGPGKNAITQARAFYPDYGILIFDSENGEKEGRYKVFLDNQVKFIYLKELKQYSKFQYWATFIKDVFIQVDASNTVYSDTIKLKKIAGSEEYGYKVVRVVGDWIYVECLKTCESCPPNKMISGWVRWKRNNMLLVELFISVRKTQIKSGLRSDDVKEKGPFTGARLRGGFV
ncbi:hypothetical protein [Paraflavitalea speifideaquila]|uniref:hypothetical protein n=1 Tax=Paraflavitalea speifideaquila TaxID=3076558 RepID=UPI0028EB1A51|nr:hypothetical protein [Paraflavitalea speifideiaquila]